MVPDGGFREGMEGSDGGEDVEAEDGGSVAPGVPGPEGGGGVAVGGGGGEEGEDAFAGEAVEEGEVEAGERRRIADEGGVSSYFYLPYFFTK